MSKKATVDDYWDESYDPDTSEERVWKFLECSSCEHRVSIKDVICRHCGAELDWENSEIDKEYWDEQSEMD